MDKLKFCLSLRERGHDTNEIKKIMKAQGFKDSEIQYYLKTSDNIFLKQLTDKNKLKKPNKSLKTIGLFLSLILLISVLLGYTTIGILGLFAIWSILGFSTSRT